MKTKKDKSSYSIKALLSDFLTAREVIELFQVTPMTIREWRLNRKLPAYRVGNGSKPITLFYRPEVLRWAQDHEKQVHRLRCL
jgi:hypothetical protein